MTDMTFWHWIKKDGWLVLAYVLMLAAFVADILGLHWPPVW